MTLKFNIIGILLLSQLVIADLQYIDTDSIADWNLTSSCSTAITSTISCDADVAVLQADKYYPTESLKTVCSDDCASALSSWEASVRDACTADSWPSDQGLAPLYTIPGTLRYLYNMTCLQIDGVYCNEVIGQAANILDHNPTYVWTNTSVIMNETYSACDDCFIGQMQVEINSPYFFDPSLPEIYSSITASCGKTDFPVSTTTIALTKTTSTAISSSTSKACAGTNYTIQKGDTCHSISISEDIGTTWLLTDNGLIAGCADFPTNGTLCLVNKCEVYTIQEGDSCKPIANSYGITYAQILSWNPQFDLQCGNINKFIGSQICISTPGGNYTSNPVTPTITTAATIPTDVATGTNTDCAQFYKVISGDYCNTIALKYGISLSDFLFLNPEVFSNCTNLYANESYCVEPVGDIATYSGYNGFNPSSTTASITAAWSDYPDSTYVPTPVNATTTDAPLANGTRSDCYYYVNGDLNYDGGDDSDVELADCSLMAQAFGTDVETLAYLNPSLSVDNCTFDASYSYCVQLSGDDSATTTTAAAATSTPDLNIRPGTLTDGCTQYTSVVSGFTCQDILDAWNITIASFYAWNTNVGSDCTGLWLDYDYCVQTNGTDVPAPSSSSSSVTSTPSEAATSTTSGGPDAPTQTGTISTCDLWHKVVSGDTCGSLETEYSITADQFLAWNPAVSSDCLTNFWPGYDYCVGISS